ncbi:MAG: hypothetical protein JW955_22465 [Sedimentisphaerales bacterium]|nr:hypothetical protein [Sedimentisphaerales bacterium]
MTSKDTPVQIRNPDSEIRECPRGTSRREFLRRLSLGVAGSAVVGGRMSRAKEALPGTGESAGALLPMIGLGEHEVTRLVVGANPISGYSYLGSEMDRQMREYFTRERVVELLSNCERAGINTHQFHDVTLMTDIIRILREQGSKMKFICLHSGGGIEQVVRDTGPIAIVHHGGVTDRLFREGKSRQVHDFVKQVHDAGILAGVSAHNPDCIRRIADEGWQVDFFMTCFHNLTRSEEEAAKMPASDALPKDHGFFASDPAAMTAVVRQVKQPCLGFKILAAGRKCDNAQAVQDAFKFAFEHLKPIDGVIVGMYPRYRDQISEDAAFTKQFGTREG